ncbi:hypothetical protein [Streptomyces chartreusis]|uniref:Lipoprotein n=1 Tax=Streptomyces chartreusis TaxID=1969 RepID=A0A7H8TE81_STRCX|nr:hypothetical protein [Streptomyces chartreusis]QKZ20350.1 hypothetical protein HUT05_25160 [Streptomyces chartreusis]
MKRGRPIRRTAATLACAAVLVALTACGDGRGARTGGRSPSAAGESTVLDGDSSELERLTAQQIYDMSRAANASAGSYRERMTRADARTNLLLSASECSGIVEVTGQGAFNVIVKDGDVWAKLDQATAVWASEQGGIVLPEGTWLHGTPEDPLMARLASWCHASSFGGPGTAGVKLSGPLIRGDVTTLDDGRQAIPVSANGASVTWYVAAVGRPYLLRQVAAHADMANITYSDFGTPVQAEAPTGSIKEAPTGAWPDSKLR